MSIMGIGLLLQLCSCALSLLFGQVYNIIVKQLYQ